VTGARDENASTAGMKAGGYYDLHSEVVEVPNPYKEALERDGDAERYAESYEEFVRAFAESTMTTHLFEPGAIGTDPAGSATSSSVVSARRRRPLPRRAATRHGSSGSCSHGGDYRAER
jgi:hypothetical protein